MLYLTRVPKPPLNRFIEALWLFRDEPKPFALQRVLPTGAAQLIINLKEDQIRLYRSDPPHACDDRNPRVNPACSFPA